MVNLSRVVRDICIILGIPVKISYSHLILELRLKDDTKSQEFLAFLEENK